MRYLILFLLFFSCTDPELKDKTAWQDTIETTELELLDSFAPQDLEYLVIHCTATYPNNVWGPKDLLNFFLKEKKWSRPGYSYYITYDGKLHPLWPINIDNKIEFSEVTNGAKNFNTKSIHIAYQGGVNSFGKASDTRTKEQIKTIENFIKVVQNASPSVKVVGHNQLPGVIKACPSFVVN